MGTLMKATLAAKNIYGLNLTDDDLKDGIKASGKAHDERKKRPVKAKNGS
jgi:hypothetical protein